MLENGIRGTFYLNSRTPEVQPQSLAHKLTAKGLCSIGGHSVSHPHLPELPANEVFYQLMANRIALECLTDRPVNSLAFPFGGYQDRARPEVLQGVTESFLRTGYHHCVYAHFVDQNPYLPANMVSTGIQVVPGDRQVDAPKFWAQMEKIRQSRATFQKLSHCIFLGVHPWQQGVELERLGQLMGKLRNWEDFWHCTQTEYAAFAKQRQTTTLKELAPGQFAITRPCAFQLGSDVPLTLTFDNPAVQSAVVDGVVCSVRHADGKTFVNVPHAARSGIPETIDLAAGEDAAKFPGLKCKLTFDPETGNAAFTLRNMTDMPLTDLLVTLSVPPAFEPGILRWKHAKLEGGTAWPIAATLKRRRQGAYWSNGRYYIAAQLDFIHDGKRGGCSRRTPAARHQKRSDATVPFKQTGPLSKQARYKQERAVIRNGTVGAVRGQDAACRPPVSRTSEHISVKRGSRRRIYLFFFSFFNLRFSFGVCWAFF